ncbi:TIGR03617 family F420-dependent LLM class oxidoreductase, partial [Prescottella soli]
MKVDVQLDGRPENAARRARELVALGVDGLFTFEGPHDVFLPLVAAAAAVDVDLMTNVAIALPRSPMHLAHTAYDLQTLSRGRFRLGLGSQIRPHIEKRYGAQWSRPAARMRETVLALKAIFDAWEGNSRLRFEGEFTTHTLMPPTFDPGPNPYGPPPICLGALGPLMTRTAAEVADGLLVMPFNSVRHFRERTLPAVEEGLERGRRSREDLAIYPQVIVGVGRTPEELDAASRGVRGLLAFYGS